MFIVHTAVNNALRYYKKCLMIFCVCIAMLLFLFFYVANMLDNRQQLQDLGKVVPVTARISNITGTQDFALQIDFAQIEAVRQTGMITNEAVMAQSDVNLVGDIMPKGKKNRPDYSCIGVNNLSVFTAFDESDVTYLKGTDDAVWESEAVVCVMRDKFLKQHELKLGDTVELDMFTSEYDKKGFLSWVFQPVGVHKFQIVGSYNPGTTMQTDNLPDIISPINTVSQIHKKAGVPHFASSFRFQVQNPLLLNDFKRQMELLNFTPVNPQAEGSRVGNTLIINDETFIRSATQITKSLTLLQLLCPLFFLLVAIISFVLSFLLMQGRKKDLAIMRSLGTGSKKVFAILLFESLIPLLLGIACGTVVFLSVMGRMPFSAVQQILLTATFAAFYLVGIILAISLINRKNVMALLSKLD